METSINNEEKNEKTSDDSRYEICAPNCPKLGQKYPHSPHISLYPTDYC